MGYGSMASLRHHFFSAVSRPMAKCRCGVDAGAFPVVPT
jgi:hypothetical protein